MKSLKTLINLFIVCLIFLSTLLTPMSLSAYQEMPEEDLCDQIVAGCEDSNPYVWWLAPVEHSIHDAACGAAGAECEELTEAE